MWRLHVEVGRRGNIIFGRRMEDRSSDQYGGWRQHIVQLSDAENFASNWLGEVDRYVTQNRFFGWRRRIANLAELGACWVDIDYYTTERFKRCPPETMAYFVRLACEKRNLPMPSYIMWTGRGLACVWLLDTSLPFAALPRWRAVQRVLAEAFAGMGVDRCASDASRVLRLAGTLNSRATDQPVGVLWVPQTPPPRYGFDTLCDEVLPYTRDEIWKKRENRRRRRAERLENVSSALTENGLLRCRSALLKCRTVETLWAMRLEDLHKLLKGRFDDGLLLPTCRDKWLLIAVIAMSWLVPANDLRAEARELARQVVQEPDWGPTEVDSRMGVVIDRALRAAAGEKIEWQGKDVDPRYRYQSSVIIERLEITDDEMRRLDLRDLASADIKRERKLMRDRERYREQKDANTRKREADRATILKLHEDGLSAREIADHSDVGVGRRRVYQILEDKKNK